MKTKLFKHNLSTGFIFREGPPEHMASESKESSGDSKDQVKEFFAGVHGGFSDVLAKELDQLEFSQDEMKARMKVVDLMESIMKFRDENSIEDATRAHNLLLEFVEVTPAKEDLFTRRILVAAIDYVLSYDSRFAGGNLSQQDQRAYSALKERQNQLAEGLK